MTSYTSSELALMMNAELKQKANSTISVLVIDSRLVFNARESLFFALKGSSHNGHIFIDDLYNKGVRNFVVSSQYKISEKHGDANFYKVNDVLAALQKLAAAHRRKFNIPVLAITGSNGKTIVKEWLSQLIGDTESLIRSPRSYNSQVGVPLSVWQMNEQASMSIFEAGISKTGEMQRLSDIIRPTYGLFTNLGTAHQQNFISSEEKLNEKLLLFQDAETIFYCRDQELTHKKISELYPDKNLVIWGKHNDADLRIINIEYCNETSFTALWKGKRYELTFPFDDAISIENMFHALLFMLYCGYEEKYLKQKLPHLQSIAMRMEQKEGMHDTLLINDTYNSDFTSLELALDFLEQQGRKKGMKRTLILSDMLQTGIPDAELYSRVAALIKSRDISRLIGIGETISSYSHLFNNSSNFFKTTQEFLAVLHRFSFSKEAILIKGARIFEFESIVSKLELKQHNTTLEINLNALVNNLNRFRSELKPETKVLAMVKAFSYGSGSYEIAGTLQHHKIDYLGVAFADEGMELRQAGITVSIMVMNPEENSFDIMLKYGLEPEVYSFRILESFNKAVEREGLSDISIHIKTDTGMNRLGFLENETDKLTETLALMPSLKVRSVFSHLAGSDDSAHDSFTLKQIDQFKSVCEKLRKGIGYNFSRHILNSAGIERFPEAQFEMVRLGIGLYGISAENNSKLENVTTLKTYISQIKEVSPHESVGYGRSENMKNGGLIAVIPIGYADGLNRHLSCGVGKVMIHGNLVPIVGKICMDMCMVDISSLKDVKEGDEVIIFGDEYPVNELAKQLDTISYEVLTGIGRRVKRVYFRE